MNSKNRRQFLKKICCLGAAGTGAHLTRLGLVSANAQSTSTYKALVCVFLFGGNDSNNMIVPVDSRYAKYQAMRTGLALPQASLLPAGATGLAFHRAVVPMGWARRHSAGLSASMAVVLLGYGLLLAFDRLSWLTLTLQAHLTA